VLANVNREATRFAVKNGTLDYTDPSKDPALVGYDAVLSHTINSLANQLPLSFDPGTANTTMIVSHFVIDTGLPCVVRETPGGPPVVPYQFDAANCDCTSSVITDTQWFSGDDLIAHPGDPRFSHYSITYGISGTTRLGEGSYQELADELALENNQFNCNILKNGGSEADMSLNNLIITESFYDQPQLLGVPLISNPLSDPIPFYSHTAMRIVSSRDAGLSDTIGPACQLLPIAILASDLENPGGLAIPPEQNLDIMQTGGNTFSWLRWDSQNGRDSTLYVAEALENQRLPITAFAADENDPDGIGDTFFDVNDWVEIAGGVDTSGTNSDTVDEFLETFVNQTVYLPVFDQIAGGAGRVAHIANVTINDVCVPADGCLSGNRQLSIAFETYNDNVCN
jgi:hypothetical protein